MPLKGFDRYKLGLDSSLGIQPFKLPLSLQNIIPVTMNKGTHFNGQYKKTIYHVRKTSSDKGIIFPSYTHFIYTNHSE